MSLQIAKQLNLARDLQERLAFRLPGFFITQSTDAVGVIVSVSQSSTPTAGQSNMIIRLAPQDTPNLDIIGNSQSVYSPTKAQVVEELASAGTSTLLDLAFKAKCDYEINALGCRQERYARANGTPPASTDITAANLKATLDNYKWQFAGQ